MRIFILSFVFLFFTGNCYAATASGLVDEANKTYHKEKYDDALKLYGQAQIKLPNSALLNYNIGAAQFKKGEYEKAVGSFEKAVITEDKILEAKANYNIGNAKYKLGKLKENTDLAATIGLLRQSLDYYKRAIELDSGDEDAKVNHELVEKELKTLLDKQKREQSKKTEDQKEQKSEEEKQQETEQEKQQSQQEKQESDEKKEAEEKQAEEKAAAEEEKQVEEKTAEAKQAEQAKEQQQGAGQEEVKEMSEQEARMLLDGLREENSSGKIEDKQRGYQREVEKDW